MPIRRFECYAEDCSFENHPISELENKRIAIDGFWYIKKYLDLYTEDDLLNPIATIETFLAPLISLRKHTDILWIWDGLEFNHQPTQEYEPLFERIQSLMANSRFSKKISLKYSKFIYDQEFFVNKITQILRDNNIVVVRAPYIAAAQGVYFIKIKAVDYVFAANDALLFSDCDALILDFDFTKQEFQICNRNRLFEANSLDIELFRRIAFLSGCEFCPTLSTYADPPNFDLIAIFNLAFDGKIKEYFETKNLTEYKTEYLNAFATVQHTLVINVNGSISEPNSSLHSESFAVFGRILSDLLYMNIFNCELGVKCLSNYLYSRSKLYLKSQENPYKTAVYNIFKRIFNGAYDEFFVSKKPELKEATVSEYLKKLLNIEYTTNIDKTIQVLSIISLDVNVINIDRLLHSGCPGKLKLETGNNDLLSILKKYQISGLMCYYMFHEALIFLNDIIAFLSSQLKLENDMSNGNFFTYEAFIQNVDKENISDFIKNNDLNHHKLKSI